MREAVVPERFVPAAMRGQLLEAEHLVRYWWAARFAAGRRVLDAGCGTAYGARMLAEAGAKQVTGVDVAASVLDAARADCPANVDLVVGDLCALPFADRSFDLVVCFEVIDRLERPDAALHELARVIARDGVLLMSAPGGLGVDLERYFGHVELRRQANLIASSVLPDDVAERGDLEPVHDVRLAKSVALPHGEAASTTIALASHAPLAPDRATTAVATGVTDVRRWADLHAEQQAALDEQRGRLRRLEEEATEVRRARGVLLDGEQAHARATKLTEELQLARGEIDRLEQRLQIADEVVRSMQRSPSWRLTAPLRTFKRALRRR